MARVGRANCEDVVESCKDFDVLLLAMIVPASIIFVKYRLDKRGNLGKK